MTRHIKDIHPFNYNNLGIRKYNNKFNFVIINFSLGNFIKDKNHFLNNINILTNKNNENNENNEKVYILLNYIDKDNVNYINSEFKFPFIQIDNKPISYLRKIENIDRSERNEEYIELYFNWIHTKPIREKLIDITFIQSYFKEWKIIKEYNPLDDYLSDNKINELSNNDKELNKLTSMYKWVILESTPNIS